MAVNKIVCEIPTNGRASWNVVENGNVRYEITFKNGPIVKYDASVNGESYSQTVKPFVYTTCQGKLWALDRLSETSYFTLHPSGEAPDLENGTLTVKIFPRGPVITFAMSVS